MATNTGSYLKGMFNAAQAIGEKAVSSDAYLEIVGAEDISLLCKQFPWPILSSAGEIEAPLPMGAVAWQSQQIKVNQQGQIALMETRQGHIAQFMERVIANGGYFDGVAYEGEPANFTRRLPIVKCFLQLDNPDRDWENRAQIVQITGTLFFHYFGPK